MSYLLRYEAKGLQNFILRTNRLREIKGGSQLINGLEDLLGKALEAQQKAGGEYKEILNQAAGGANILFQHEESAKAFKASWPMLVERATPGLQVIVDYVPMAENGEGSVDAWETLQGKLHAQRNRKMANLPEANPAVFRAPRTGLPAFDVFSVAGGGKERQDRALYRRSKAGEPVGRNNEAVGARLDEQQEWATDISKHMQGEVIATIHIDGNDLGKRIRELLANTSGGSTASERIKAFSECLSDITKDAAIAGYRAALHKWQEEGDVGEVFPGRPIILGGDDFTMIVRADLAFTFTSAYLKAFEELSHENQDKLGGALTACAGIAFTSVSFPFNMAHDLAEQLCSYAKSKLRGRGVGGSTSSAVAFHRVTTSMIESYEDILATELSGPDDLKGYLAAAPYTLHPTEGFVSMKQLEELECLLRHFPTGPVRETIRLLGQDRQKAAERWGRLREVMDDNPKQKAAWKNASDAMGGSIKAIWEFHKAGQEPCTPLLDAWVLRRAYLRK